jgi:hypothetical protein
MFRLPQGSNIKPKAQEPAALRDFDPAGVRSGSKRRNSRAFGAHALDNYQSSGFGSRVGPAAEKMRTSEPLHERPDSEVRTILRRLLLRTSDLNRHTRSQ